MRSNGAIVDEQGKLNNFAVEPKMYVQENPRTGFTPYAEIGQRASSDDWVYFPVSFRSSQWTWVVWLLHDAVDVSPNTIPSSS
jgi:hypothetical protein